MTSASNDLLLLWSSNGAVTTIYFILIVLRFYNGNFTGVLKYLYNWWFHFLLGDTDTNVYPYSKWNNFEKNQANICLSKNHQDVKHVYRCVLVIRSHIKHTFRCIVRCLPNAVNFLQINHKEHSICRVWYGVSSVCSIYHLCFASVTTMMQECHVIFDRVITAPDYITNISSQSMQKYQRDNFIA